MKADIVMNQTSEKKTNIILIIFNVLFWGSLWGVVEATLGTFLHFPFFHKLGMYASSSTIIIPIAYYLMANCYKRTNSPYAVFLMGCLASMFKLMVGFVVGFKSTVFNPAIYIVVEALAMGSALAIFRPSNVLSLKTFVAMIVTNTIYQFSYLLIRMALGGVNIFASENAWIKSAEPYLFTINCLAILYTFVSGAISYGIIKLFERYHKDYKFPFAKLIQSPITASIAILLAITFTMTFAAIF